MRVIARNGNIEIYLNGTQLMVTPPMDWPDGDSPGLIGLFAFYPVAARVDDFAGGSCGCP